MLNASAPYHYLCPHLEGLYPSLADSVRVNAAVTQALVVLIRHCLFSVPHTVRSSLRGLVGIILRVPPTSFALLPQPGSVSARPLAQSLRSVLAGIHIFLRDRLRFTVLRRDSAPPRRGYSEPPRGSSALLP